MSNDRPTLAATKRDVLGKRVASLRRAGQLPAVVFGHGVPSQPLSLDSHEFELLQRRIGQNALVDLSVEGKKPTPVLVQGVQRDPVYRSPSLGSALAWQIVEPTEVGRNLRSRVPARLSV